MAFAEFSFKKDSRVRVATILRALLILQLILAISFVIFCYNASAKVLILLMEIHKQTILFVYAIVLVHAYCVKLHYTIGLRMTSTVLNYVYWQNTTVNYRLWMVFGTFVTLNGILLSEALKCTLNALMQDLTMALRTGIPQYLSEPSWKKLYDALQIELKCCGMEGLTDWHEIPWISLDFLNDDSNVVQEMLGPDGKILPPVVPFSCCNPGTLGACYHDPLQQANLKSIWELEGELVVRSLHERGCVVAVHQPLEYAIYGLRWFSNIVFILQVVILGLTQLLLTSCRSAALAGDLGGTGLAWIFKPDLQKVASEEGVKSKGRREQEESVMGASTVQLLEERRRRTHRYCATTTGRRSYDSRYMEPSCCYEMS